MPATRSPVASSIPMAKSSLKPLDCPVVDTSLTKSAFVGNLGRVKELLEPASGKAPDVSEKDTFGCNSLTWAVRNGSTEVTEYLLGKDGDAESLSYGGFKPVHHACNMSREATLKQIIEAGCNVSSTDDCGNTALHWAAARGVLNCVLILLEAGARVDEKNNAGATPLHRAANNGHVNIVSALIKEGANVNEQDEAGNTPLHAAASTGFDAVVKVLCSNGARIAANRSGRTPIDVSTTSACTLELEKVK